MTHKIIITKNPNKIPEGFSLIVTRDDYFKAIDVVALALLSFIFGDIAVFRTNHVTKSLSINAKFIYNVGGGTFNNHKKEKNGMRTNKVPYSFLGLIWKKYGMCILKDYKYPKAEFQCVDEKFIQYFDSKENGITTGCDLEHTTLFLPKLLECFNPNWNELKNYEYISNGALDKDQEDDASCDDDNKSFAQLLAESEGTDQATKTKRSADIFYDCIKKSNAAFVRAFYFAYTSLELTFRFYDAMIEAKPLLDAALAKSKDGILVLKYNIPWKKYLLNSKDPKAAGIKVVIFPSTYLDEYLVKCVPTALVTDKTRVKIPDYLYKLDDAELPGAIGVLDVKFIKRESHVIGVGSFSGAMQVAKFILNN